jgi:hypothetical protein
MANLYPTNLYPANIVGRETEKFYFSISLPPFESQYTRLHFWVLLNVLSSGQSEVAAAATTSRMAVAFGSVGDQHACLHRYTVFVMPWDIWLLLDFSLSPLSAFGLGRKALLHPNPSDPQGTRPLLGKKLVLGPRVRKLRSGRGVALPYPLIRFVFLKNNNKWALNWIRLCSELKSNEKGLLFEKLFSSKFVIYNLLTYFTFDRE